MRYMGSKARHAKEILGVMLPSRGDRPYVEPFAGGLHVIQRVNGERWANDANLYLVELHKAVQEGVEMPDTISECLYSEVKANPDFYDPWLVGFIGFGCSFGGRFFGGYARGRGANYASESKRSLQKQRPLISGVILTNIDYRDMDLRSPSLVYCDPPYSGTNKYHASFCSVLFWDWVRFLVVCEDHKVFVSEYQAPDDFVCVWSKSITNRMDRQNPNARKGVERLFVHESQALC